MQSPDVLGAAELLPATQVEGAGTLAELLRALPLRRGAAGVALSMWLLLLLLVLVLVLVLAVPVLVPALMFVPEPVLPARAASRRSTSCSFFPDLGSWSWASAACRSTTCG